MRAWREERERERERERESSSPYRIDITRVDDLDGDGAVGLSDVEHLLRLDANAADPLEGDGDFRSQECIETLKQADIVVTNPPFSLFREYLEQLIEHDKKFLILGSQNAITYKETFQHITAGQLWLGVNNGGDKWFQVPEDYKNRAAGHSKRENGAKYHKLRNVNWFTNLDHPKRHEELILYRKYTPEEYPHYDNYDAINVDKVADIPEDWDGAMGVPITFLDKWNPDQFEIVNANDFRRTSDVPFKAHGLIKDKDSAIDGKPKYVRLVIRRLG